MVRAMGCLLQWCAGADQGAGETVPIYEYLCQECQHRFELKQGMSDAPVTTCRRCGGPVTKLISAPAIMFKGTGWYVTDYSDKMKPPAESGSGDKPADGQQGQKEQPDKKEPAPAVAGTGATSDSGGAAASDSSSGSSSSSTSPSSPPSSSPSPSSPTSSAPSSSSSSSSSDKKG